MLSKEMDKALNEQLNREFYSAYVYLAMSSWCDQQDLPGFANWFRIQAQEELSHAMKFYDFINEAGGHSLAAPVDGPQTSFASVTEAFEETLKHEQEVSAHINRLVDAAIKESDHASNIFLQWFVTEQVEEESTVSQLLSHVRRVGDDGRGLLILDNELAQRVFTPPV